MKSIVVGTRKYQELLEPYGEVTHYHPGLLNSISEYDCIMFTGGADVSPSKYGEAYHPKTSTCPDRDTLEFDLWQHALKYKHISFVGICRGAQLLCVANGDTLIQHVDGHTNKVHNIVTESGEIVETIGDHHQMMRPDNGNVIAWSVDISDIYENGAGRTVPYFNEKRRIIEPEVVYYPASGSLCVQFHPEWADKEHVSRKYFDKLIKEFVL